MKSLLLAMTATVTAAALSPASAQTSAHARGTVGIHNRIAQLETRMEAGIRSGEIDRREARLLRRQLRQIERTERQYSRDGLTVEERQDLQLRLRAMRQDIRLAGGGNDRFDRWDDEGYYGQGGPIEDDGWVVDESGGRSGGISGLFDSLLGRGGLTVGQRVTGNLYAVPGEYRSRFRDNSNVYFRSDGSRVYEIDADTHTVVRVYTRDE